MPGPLGEGRGVEGGGVVDGDPLARLHLLLAHQHRLVLVADPGGSGVAGVGGQREDGVDRLPDDGGDLARAPVGGGDHLEVTNLCGAERRDLYNSVQQLSYEELLLGQAGVVLLPLHLIYRGEGGVDLPVLLLRVEIPRHLEEDQIEDHHDRLLLQVIC